MKFESGFWTDANNNKWECSFYTETNAEQLSKTLVNCRNMINCSYCTNCSYCMDCKGCSDCRECTNCSFCNACRDCANCSYCDGCSNCENCRRSKNCKGCRECKDCSDFQENPQRITGKRMGRRDDFPVVYWIETGKEQCVVGCFCGTLSELEKKVEETHKNNSKHYKDYMKFIKCVRKYQELTEGK